MPAGTYNFTIEQGATFRKTLTWTDAANAPINNTGYTGKLQIRTRVGGSILAELTTVNGGITMGGSNGVIDLYLADEATQLLTAKSGVYDLLVTSPAGEATRVIQGKVTIKPEVTVP